ncbi:zinc finger protein JAGGED-like [Cucurbita moschata]|uniref:Zinc finger protein JAGGED-like n=1 Tax=Cucurbita moschata TaxID=3662 RepID=A0A6J1GRC2_CUCMO|nr:zinc finger protein JAGGED-like [Cucurbita moschata]
MMRSQGSPLDLNNLPEDYIRDRKQIIEDTSTGHRKKKSGGKEGNEESGKVYECRFCSLKFCKSQALGGHMNRHRQERETETLNRARQLVFSNDNLAVQSPPPHLGCCHSMTPGSYHTAGSGGVGSDPTLSLRFPTRMFPGSSPTTLLPPTPSPPPPPPPHQPYLYSSPSRPSSFPSYYPPPQASINDYYVGHVLGNPAQCSHQTMNYGSTRSSMESSSYTCIGAPVGPAATFGGRESGSGRDGSQQQRLDVPSSINRFQDGF